ncbi:undecaprenyldiphospho-muramoylpentapeptide beta-N-acetylglucosaminyltransferase [Sporosarcina sp. P37]|uniref:undecaprenyldiphospho-muramoylpentapeptide beta-N-acetylglucosaminyltransferase n=1 Tax=unclassified Sporosarcina TaxID=2647733 RepID=UPI000A17C2D9|nr:MULTISPECIES: undecaprenyldiphospho-muramoylpentapeptide beta-N-acetylglucosaminyltransferase [unclassified Sporosarcina]ARK23462.1 undecaprenyldiphospho-muramoylpentapeptide beta-N-acetylglucosaminyltransferase [Sporosarcina sp. P37]PID18673.1 undecaprenyldiphospho-muramoylpentapeptide beta-N-acetylglucosaminyltransferase [Sporosarcina sp. P35]
MKQPVVVLTGGGTAGHVSVNQALIPVFLGKGYGVHYIGSHEGIEKELIGSGHPEVVYHAIQSGKLRRYFSMKNFTDPFRVGAGTLQALAILRKIKPEIIFSKGGFVSVPVVMAAKLANVPVVVHESDVTPGLANRLALPFSSHIFTVFEQTLQYVPAAKSACTGPIIRPELFSGDKERGLRMAGLTAEKPVFIIMGGSQGSAVLNETIRAELPELLARYQLIHLCGKGNVDPQLSGVAGYAQYEYVTDELPDLLAAADYAISRAGSNAIFELLAIHKPMLLVPLAASKSRGDQILNAKYFASKGLALQVEEEQFADQPVAEQFAELVKEKSRLLSNIEKTTEPKTPEKMADLILSFQK